MTRVREEFLVIEEVAAADLRYAKGEVPVRNRFKDLFTEPLAEFHDPLLGIGRTEMPAFA